MAGGRPSQFKAELIPKLLEEMGQGKSLVRFCRDHKINWQTFHNWKEAHKELLDAFEQGKKDCEAYWEEWLVNNLENKNMNAVLVKMYFANRFGWHDKTEQKHDVTVRQEDALKDLE